MKITEEEKEFWMVQKRPKEKLQQHGIKETVYFGFNYYFPLQKKIKKGKQFSVVLLKETQFKAFLRKCDYQAPTQYCSIPISIYETKS